MRTVREIERRFIVKSVDPDILQEKRKHIVQGYFETRPDCSFRVRVTDDAEAELTKKTGANRDRIEQNHAIDLDTARFLMDERIVDIIRKTRYLRENWEVDFFEGALSGLVLAEYEMPDIAFPLSRPPWIHDWIEVTDSLTNRHLARFSRDLVDERGDRPVRDILPKRIPRVVLTGGPCSGKSEIMKMLRAELGEIVHCVPEVASIVITQVRVRPPMGDPIAGRSFQRTMYRLQLGFETVSDLQALQDGKKALLLDRGTLDGAAYLRGALKEFERVCRTTREHEYSMYDMVICLETPDKEVYDANCRSNPARSEGYEAARELGKRIKEVWSDHPNFRAVKRGSWDDKVAAVKAHVGMFLSQH